MTKFAAARGTGKRLRPSRGRVWGSARWIFSPRPSSLHVIADSKRYRRADRALSNIYHRGQR